MFDWVWDMFYGISKSIFSIIDNLLACANMLCGIQPITYRGEETDFIGFLINNQAIMFAFVAAVIIGIVLVFVFGIIAIIRTISSEKIEKTPAQIAIQIGKTLIIFLFIPASFTVLMYFTNIIMKVLYSATLGGSPDGLGRFLAGAFAQDALSPGTPSDFYLIQSFNYRSTSSMRDYVNLKDYDFFFSWIAGIVILISLGGALLVFVDRAISIVVLFIFSPISLSTAVLDDGARFKLWRDQFIVKLLTGYGCIVAINIYALIVGAITANGLVFFEDKILNNVMKIIIIVGGGVSMTRMMSLVGNLISQGAGSNEMRDNAIATMGFGRALSGTVGAIKKPFGATRSAFNFVRDSKNIGLGTTIGRNLGFRTARDYRMEQGQLNLNKLGGSGSVNNNTAEGSSSLNNSKSQDVKNAIIGGGNKGSNGGSNGGGNNNGDGGRSRSNSMALPGSNRVNESVNNALRNNNNGGKKK